VEQEAAKNDPGSFVKGQELTPNYVELLGILRQGKTPTTGWRNYLENA
jgi:hypothetical protein